MTLAYNRGDFTGNNAITSDDTTTAIAYAPADTTNWLIGFPTVTTSYAGLGIGGTKLSETLTSYDGASSCTTPAGSATTVTKGHVTKVERWLNGGTNPISGMAYNAFGGLTCTRDPKGNTTTIAYDPTSTFPLTSTNALGHVTTTSYYGVNGVASDTGLYGQAKSVTDPNGKITTNTYDALGRKLTTTTPDGLVNTMVYNYGGAFVVGTQHIQSTTSGGGLAANLVSKTYFDGLGRTTKKESPGAADGGGSLKVLVTETQYDVRGLTAKSSLPYIQTGGVTATSLGLWRTMTYDAVGRMIQSTNPDGTSSQVCYNGWTTTSLDPKLHKKVETKDALGRLVTVQEYTGAATTGTCAGGTLYATTTYSYDLRGNLLSVTDTKGNVSTMTYDSLNRKLTMHDPDMGNWAYTYDANGNLLTQVDAKNQKLCFTYDSLNRRTQKNYGTTTVACGTNAVVYAYDDTVVANNGKGRLKQVSDAAQSVTFQYDSRGRISQSAKTLDGTTYTTTSAYDGLGRLTTVNYPTTPIKTVTYAYDGPQLKSVLEGTTAYVSYGGWNALGQPATATFGNGVVTTSTYADLNNVTCSTPKSFRLCTLKTTGPSGSGGGIPALTGSLTDHVSPIDLTAEGTTDWMHWGEGGPTNVNRKVGGSAISAVTALGPGSTVDGQGWNPTTSVTWTNGTPTASATAINSIRRDVTSTTATGFQFTVPADTTLKTLKVMVLVWVAHGKFEATLSDGSAAAYVDTSVDGSSVGTLKKIYTIQYRAASANQTLTVKWTSLPDVVGGQIFLRAATLATSTGGGSAGAAYQDLQYAYDLAGNVTGIIDNVTPLNTQTLTYDDLDRLDTATGSYGFFDYAYDQIGNVTVNPQLGAYAYPASNSSSVRPHAVCATGGTGLNDCATGTLYTYDANGNMLTGAGRTYTWNPENKPLTIVQGGTTTTFIYDGDGGRVKKIVGTTTTRYLSKLYECDNTNCSRFIWAGSTRIATIAVNTGTVNYWHGDHLGSSSVITDSTGAKVETLTYYPFGGTRTNTSPSTPAIDVPYKYTGKELDASTGLYYYEARYYDATLARFISPDTIVSNLRDPQSLNRYSYVGNNPLRYTDPTGHLRITIKLRDVKRWFVSSAEDQVCYCSAATTPEGRRAYASYTAGAIGSFVCGPVCGGAAAGATNAALNQMSGRRANILRSSIAGAVGGLAGGVANLAVPGDMVMAGLAGGAANGAASAAIGGGNVLEAALMGGATGALTGYYNSQGIVDRTSGPIWNGPNTLIGAGFLALNGIASVPSLLTGGSGMGFSMGNGGLQFWNAPLVDGGVRLGDITLIGGIDRFGNPLTPSSMIVSPYEGHPTVELGRHEGGHGIQEQVLGPLFFPLYFSSGGVSSTNPFEIGADNYSTGRGSPWSGF